MKKCLVMAASILLSTFALKAQETSFGLKAGVNVSTLSVTNGTDFDSKAGFHVGGLAHIHLNKNWAIQPEIMYSTQGGKIGDFQMDLNYINVPVLVQYMTQDGFRLQTGPQLGFLTNAESEFGDGEADRTEEFKKVDFAWTLGAGYLFPAGIGIDARYNFGIANVRDLNDYEAKNNVLQLGLFYQFMKQRTARNK